MTVIPLADAKVCANCAHAALAEDGHGACWRYGPDEEPASISYTETCDEWESIAPWLVPAKDKRREGR